VLPVAATATREEIDRAHERLDAEEDAAATARPEGAADDGDNIGGPAPVQTGLFDRVIEHPELEKLLDERAAANVKKLAATAKFKEKHDAAKALLEAQDLEDGTVVRCGNHRITVKRSEPRDVAFTTGGKRTIRIFPIGDES
jgi:hypothetical protein